MTCILVIDDDEQIRKMFRSLLEREGYEVKVAPDGKQGILQYRNNPADLVILDIIMPEKEGLETIMDLRRDFPDIKIIAISGGGRIGPEDYLMMAKNLGAMRTFVKPVERYALLKAIGELIGGIG